MMSRIKDAVAQCSYLLSLFVVVAMMAVAYSFIFVILTAVEGIVRCLDYLDQRLNSRAKVPTNYKKVLH